MSDTVKAGTLRAPQSPAEYFEARRANEWVKRGELRAILAGLQLDYRALFEKEQQERAKALAALGQGLVDAHERILALEAALDLHEATSWESRLALRWARVKLAVRRWLGRKTPVKGATLERPLYPEPSATDPRD